MNLRKHQAAVASSAELQAMRIEAVPALADYGGKRQGAGRPGPVPRGIQADDVSLNAAPAPFGNAADYKTAKVKRAALAGDEQAKSALEAAKRGEVKSAAELERMAGLAKPPPTPAQKVKRAMRKAGSPERVTAALQAVEMLSPDDRSRLFVTCRERGWLQ